MRQPGGTRGLVLAYVRDRGAARMTEIMAALGLVPGAASGHLSWLVSRGYLERPARGVYVIPGTSPELPPPVPMSAAVASRNRTVWKNLPQAERDRRVEAMARGRREAADRRYQARRH